MDHEQLHDAVLNGDAEAALAETEAALAAGVDPGTLVQHALIPAMDEVGRRFEEGEYFVPELLIAARAMKASLALIRPLLAECGIEPIGRVVIGTITGDQHDIGKNLVASMLEGAGFEIIDLGFDVKPGEFVEAVREHHASMVGLSALLTTTMPAMKTVVDALEAAGLRSATKVIIGGAPITQAYADDIGADGYAPNASAAVSMARRLLEP